MEEIIKSLEAAQKMRCGLDWIKFDELMHTMDYMLRIVDYPFKSVTSKSVNAYCRSSTPPPRFMNRGMEGHMEQMGRGRAPGYQGTHMMQDNRSEREKRGGRCGGDYKIIRVAL